MTRTLLVLAAVALPGLSHAQKVFLSPTTLSSSVTDGGTVAEFALDNAQRTAAKLQSTGLSTDIQAATIGSASTAAVDAANLWGADVFVSISSNAGGSHGVETFFLTGSTNGNALANDIQTALLAQYTLPNLGVATNSTWDMLKRTAMPAAVTFVVFHDCITPHATLPGSVSESAFLIDPNGRNLIATGIASGVCAYLSVTPCTADSGCTAGYYCSSTGSCLQRQPNGDKCDLTADCKVPGCRKCTSLNCVDGYCCDTACANACDSCNGADLGWSSAANGVCATATGFAGAPSCSPYFCDGASVTCPNSCGSDNDCVATYYCSSAGACVQRRPNGVRCDLTADCRVAGCRKCTSGSCVDGYCCDTGCSGACVSCKGADLSWTSATNGTCAIAPAGFAGTPTCSPYNCNGASATCPSPCSTDNDCITGYYCSAKGTCLQQKGQGANCSDCKTDGCRVCSTGFCADGFCCDEACATPCRTCAATIGTCTIVADTDDVPECTGASTCDAKSICRLKNGQGCLAGTDCASTFCSDGKCCDSACSGGCNACSVAAGALTDGTCRILGAGNPGNNAACSPYVCGGTYASCLTSCTLDSNCGSMFYCASDGTCQPRKNQSAGCNDAAGADCRSAGCRVCVTGFCVDGACCDTACAGTCMGCAVTGSVGVCLNLPALSQDTFPSSACVAPNTCNGAGACKKENGQLCPGGAGDCASGDCVDGVCCDSACMTTCMACNVSGHEGTCTAMPALAEDTNASTQCVSPNACDGSGTCRLACGQSCTGSAQCASGFCANGVCCSSACNGACQVCGAGGLCGGCATSQFCNGTTCVVLLGLGSACASDNQCASNHCVDGVCCDQTCGGVCQACTALKKGSGADGTCDFIAAATDPDGECTGVAPCSGACNGTGACAYPGSSRTCGPASCTGETFQATSACNGAGTCLPGASSDCSPYMCASGDATCLTSCTRDDDCAAGFYCHGTTCQPKLSLKAPCSTNAQCQSGACADSVCCDTACTGSCHSCDLTGSEGTCTQVSDGQDPRKECQASSGGDPKCAGSCQSGQCAFPDKGFGCGTCSACDGTGRCTFMPADDSTCGTIDCSGLNTTCRTYDDLSSGRCASLGSCKTANDPASCTHWTDLPCNGDAGIAVGDGGQLIVGDGGTISSSADAGSAQSSKGCGCSASGGESGLSALLLLAFRFVRGRRSNSRSNGISRRCLE